MNRFLLLSLALLLAYVPLVQAQTVPVTTTSDDARAHFEEGRARMAHADFAGAREHLDAALAADPSFGLAHMYRAIASPSDLEAEHMRRASAADVSEGEGQMIASYAAHLEDDHEREVALLRAVAEQFPDDPHPPFNLGFELYGLDRHDEAITVFRQSIARDAAFAGAHNGLGYAAMEAGDDATAERAFRDYIRLAPDEANPYDSYGEFLMIRGRYDEAEAQFEQALARNPDFAASANNLARVGIERSNRRFEQAVASGDADAVAALYTAGAVAYPPGAPPVRGREAIRELFAGFVAGGVDGVDLETLEVRAMGDYAHEMGIGRISVGSEVGDPFSYSVLWMKDGDEWRLHRDIWNSDGPEPTSAKN